MNEFDLLLLRMMTMWFVMMFAIFIFAGCPLTVTVDNVPHRIR